MFRRCRCPFSCTFKFNEYEIALLQQIQYPLECFQVIFKELLGSNNYQSLTVLTFQRLFSLVINEIKIQRQTLMSANLTGSKPRFSKESFDIHQEIGKGQFGIVYRAIDKESKAQIALKIIPKEKVSNTKNYSQLRRQIEIQSRLKHKHICELYSYFHDEQNIYIILEYCKHGSLGDQIHKNEKYFSNKKIASIFQQLIYAIAFMQQRHVMHRDLKLQNILLDQDYNIKISDFGWSRHHNKTDPNKRTTFCGTMEYISPQMVNQKPYTDSIDIYSIGIILYELFYLASPFKGADEDETFFNITYKEVVFQDDFRMIPIEAKELILKLLDKNPSKRPTVKNLFHDNFIIKYLSSDQSKLGQKKSRFTQELFIKWQEEMGIGTKATTDVYSQTQNKDIQSFQPYQCTVYGEVKKQPQSGDLEQEKFNLERDNEPKTIEAKDSLQFLGE